MQSVKGRFAAASFLILFLAFLVLFVEPPQKIYSQNGTDTQIRYGPVNPTNCAPHAMFANTAVSPTAYYVATIGSPCTWAPIVGGSGTGIFVPNPILRRWAYTVAVNACPTTSSPQTTGDTWSSLSGPSAVCTVNLGPYVSGAVWFKNTAFELSTGTASGAEQIIHGQAQFGNPSNLLLDTTIAISTTSSVRLRVGFCPSNVLCYSSDTPNLDMASFRFSTSASDTDFMCETGDGTAETITSSVVAPTASSTINTLATLYRLQILFNDSAPSVSFYINGSLVCTNTTHLPTLHVPLAQWAAIDPTAAVGTAETLWLPYTYVEADSF